MAGTCFLTAGAQKVPLFPILFDPVNPVEKPFGVP
jgi:hypothetical protein